MRPISTITLLACIAMTGMTNPSAASAAQCAGVRKITGDNDYLANMLSVIESDCLQDAANNEALLKDAFSSAEVLTTEGNEWTNYQISIRPEGQRTGKEIYIRFSLQRTGEARRKVMANAQFRNMPSLTQDVFVDTWKAKRRPSLRSPHLPADLDAFDYALAGARPGHVKILTAAGNAVISLIYEEK